jgi:hypothetical protein
LRSISSISFGHRQSCTPPQIHYCHVSPEFVCGFPKSHTSYPRFVSNPICQHFHLQAYFHKVQMPHIAPKESVPFFTKYSHTKPSSKNHMNSHTNTQFLNCSVCKTYKQNETTHSVINNSLASKFFLQAYHQTYLSPHTDSIPTSNPSDLVPPYVIVVSKNLHHPYKILLTQNSPYYFRPFLHVSSTENPQHIIPTKANSILLPSSQCTE